MKIEQEESKKRLLRCLVCEECERSESKKRVFVTRDLNSAMNICGQTHPVAFYLDTTGLSITAAAETDGQSADFTPRHGRAEQIFATTLDSTRRGRRL